jgi:hypothetical protein
MKTKLAQEKVTQIVHPSVEIKTKIERKETIKEKKNKLHTQKQRLKNNDLDRDGDKEVCRPLMTFTRVFYSADEERKTMYGFQTSLNRKNSMKIVKKATRSNQQDVYSSKRQMPRLKGKKY